MSGPRTFPVLLQYDRQVMRNYAGPLAVPWDFIAEHEAWCRANHDQSATRLAQRGGLSPAEMCAVVENRQWHRMTLEESTTRLVELLSEWNARHGGAL